MRYIKSCKENKPISEKDARGNCCVVDHVE